MKFYIASRTSQINRVQKMIEVLVNEGHVITHDWTRVDKATLERPYDQHVETVTDFALKDIEGAENADIFIILGDKSGTGMYVELGAALAGGAKVYAVG